MADQTVQLNYFQFQELVSQLVTISCFLEEMNQTLKEMRDAQTGQQTEAISDPADHKRKPKASQSDGADAET